MTVSSALRMLAEEIKEATGYGSGVMDSAGSVLACTGREPSPEDAAAGVGKSWTSGGFTFLRTDNCDETGYILFTESVSEDAVKSLKLAAMAINPDFAALRRTSDKLDRSAFLRDIINDKLSRDEIYRGSRLFKVPFDRKRTAILVTVSGTESDPNVADVVKNIFTDRLRQTVIELDPRHTLLLAEIREPYAENLDAACRDISDTVSAELLIKAVISSGRPAEDLDGIARSYREAVMAFEIGSIFQDHESIVHYDRLGLGRLVYQLPPALCDLFLDEIFKDGTAGILDAEMQGTVNGLFENNLNVSETARQLYVHRNTVLYRLERLYRATGLDIKQFEDAILLKIALMVKKYKETKEEQRHA